MGAERIAVVGAGATGTCVLDALARSLPGRAEVTVFDGSGRFGPGRAYHPGGGALVNVPAGKMSLRPDEPGHFRDWLAAIPGGHPEFVSRELYGRYLAEVFGRAAGRVRARTVPARVVAAERDGGGYRLRTGDGGTSGFDAVFLCVGTAGPSDVHGLAGRPGYLADPYPLTGLAAIAPDAPVAVLGAGLSAVDAVLELARRGHRGPLWMVSRSGYLPGVRDTASAPALRHAGAEAVKEAARARGSLSLLDVHRVLRGEFAAQGVPLSALWREFRPGEDPADRLRRQLRQAAERRPALPVFLAVAGLLLEHAWRLFDDDTRARVLRHWHGPLARLCAPMPAETAARLVALADAGALRIAGGVTGVDPRDGGFRVRLGSAEVDVAHVVGTVRPTPVPIPAPARALVGSLVAAGLADPHPLGGLRLDADTATVLDRSGLPVRGLYALGELATGELYVETTVLVAITRRVRQAVHNLLGRYPMEAS